MTHKYYYVRREIYEQDLKSKFNSKRNFKDMVRLFKLSLWVLLVTLIVATIVMFILIILKPGTFWFLITIFLLICVSIISQVLREKYLYHEFVREEELEKLHEDYEQYVNDISKILDKHGVIGEKKIIQLKCECEAALKVHNQKYNKIGNKIFDMLIGVPLGALIASAIYAESSVNTKSVIIIIFAGIIFAAFNKIIQYLYFYTEGYFKDKYMLDILNELNYSTKKDDKTTPNIKGNIGNN